MLKNILATALLAMTLMFSGCGDEAGEDRLAAQNAIDRGNPQDAINILEGLTNPTADETALLADAYAGRAGFSVTDITLSIMDASTGTEDDLKNLAESLLAQASDTAVADLTLATETYMLINPRTDDQNLKLALTYVVLLGVQLTDTNVTSAELVDTANLGFDIIASVLPEEMQTNVADIKILIDPNSDGIIVAEMDAYLASIGL